MSKILIITRIINIINLQIIKVNKIYKTMIIQIILNIFNSKYKLKKNIKFLVYRKINLVLGAIKVRIKNKDNLV